MPVNMLKWQLKSRWNGDVNNFMLKSRPAAPVKYVKNDILVKNKL